MEIQEARYPAHMKATIDIPDELYRKVKAKSALEGRPVREVAIDLFRAWLGEPSASNDGRSVGELMADLCGLVDSGVSDLATNPAYLGDLGRESLGNR